MNKLKLSIEDKPLSIDFNEHFSNLVQINQNLNAGSRESYKARNRIYVDVPEIVGITGACENVDTLFKIGNGRDLPLFFTQTGQLALEQALQSFSAVWTVIHSGRDEEEEDERHLRQFRLTEEEFDATTLGMNREKYDEDKMYEALLQNIQETVQSMVKNVLQDYKKILQNVYKRDVAKLQYASTHEFLRISYKDAVKLLNKNGFPKVSFGDDLKANHEAKIVELLNKGKTELPVFIMKYPKEIKFFNMKVSSVDPRVCLSADLIFPYAGEGTGASVREHDFKRLNERLITSTMYKLHIKRGGKYEDFKWYLDIMEKKATQPHAGYGIGNERVVQYIFGEKDIRDISVFSLLNIQTGDWDKKRYGLAPLISSEKKHVLLTIGRVQDKKALLPAIKLANKNPNIIFYATEKTYAFLKENDILSTLVYKISQTDRTPNIATLLQQQVFDAVINIPNRTMTNGHAKAEKTDGQRIRRTAVGLGLSPITDLEVATMVLENMSQQPSSQYSHAAATI